MDPGVVELVSDIEPPALDAKSSDLDIALGNLWIFVPMCSDATLAKCLGSSGFPVMPTIATASELS
ncbi:hypothetical protein GCM10027089_23130 [Nocardia thraciensis]